ncbi:hypothetical protein H4R22_001452 [Coemansia sp. RSA 1290]|nr:hypothetical protein H4R22_001452 [Coemansia sp. RSA 1290]KAJ2647915.1 hypothetical protein IWW40_004344 [Coemansia sp. RSA 1250]
MADELAVLDWITQHCCAHDDHELLEGKHMAAAGECRNTANMDSLDLLPLRKCVSKRIKRQKTDSAAQAEAETAGQLDSDGQPLHIVFYKLRTALDNLDPAYLGLEETEEMLEQQQPWASPLNLQRMAKPLVSKRSRSPLSDSEAGGGSLQPFSSPFNSPSRPTQHKRQNKVDKAAARSLDIPELIYLLITAENARRHFANELRTKMQAQKSVGDQSERWQHKLAKRNIAAETKFENILVALKELVVLRTVADIGRPPVGELAQVLSNAALQQQPSKKPLQAKPHDPQAPDSGFDAAQGLAVLNLMFPLDPLHADTRWSLSTNKWQQRYAFPLQHVPNPRMQLHQLLCETEAWISGDERVTTSVGVSASASSSAAATTCPTWLAAARGLAWGQLKQSCQSYIRDTHKTILKQHFACHPWVPLKQLNTSLLSAENQTSSAEAEDVYVPEPIQDLGDIGIRTAKAVINDNKALVNEVMSNVNPNTTIVERIAKHSRMVNIRFSHTAAFEVLAYPQKPASSSSNDS